jgi:hypothetical protein
MVLASLITILNFTVQNFIRRSGEWERFVQGNHVWCGVFPFEKNHKLYILVHVIFEKEKFAVAMKKCWVS